MAQKKLVIIDDDTFLLNMTKELLVGKGFDVQSADNGQEGLNLVKSTKPDLVLLDVMMLGMDGYQVCRKIKEDEEIKDIKVILVTGRDREVDEYLGKLSGSDGYIVKPFDMEMLLATIREKIGE